MSTSCFQTSTIGNIITIEKKCNCFEHSIHNNEWIPSNTKNVHRWHISFPKKSKCKIGIISNKADEKQPYFFDYENLTQYQGDYSEWAIPYDVALKTTIVITLTLDLSHNSAMLYYFENYNTSLKHMISNDIPKGNDIKYKFTIKQISLFAETYQKKKVSMFSETINQTCLFENYDLTSISSIVQFARHTAHCLVYGYISINTKLTIPKVIKELCVYYFVGGKYFMQDFREDLLCDLNPTIKAELFPLLLNIIYPGKQNIACMLQKLIDYCHAFHTLAAACDQHRNCFDKDRKQCIHVYDKSLYLSVLISFADIIDFYPILSTIDSDSNYNELIIKITNFQGSEGIQLVYKLLKQNKAYYCLYAQNCKFDTYSIRQHAFRICSKQSDIIYLRELLAPFVADKFQLMVNITSINLIISCLLKQLSDCNEIQWLWLYREVYMMASIQNKYSDEYLLSIIFDISSQIQLAQLITEKKPSDAIDKEFERYRCAQIAVKILYVITEMNELNVRYEITNLNNFLEFVTITFRSNECGIVGWKILNMEINKLLNSKQYTYYGDWLAYIESKCGLIKSNFVKNINIIKNKSEGNKANAQKQLEMATKTCHNINKLPLFKLKKFTTLYGQIKKTKLLKPIFENL